MLTECVYTTLLLDTEKTFANSCDGFGKVYFWLHHVITLSTGSYKQHVFHVISTQ